MRECLSSWSTALLRGDRCVERKQHNARPLLFELKRYGCPVALGPAPHLPKAQAPPPCCCLGFLDLVSNQASLESPLKMQSLTIPRHSDSTDPWGPGICIFNGQPLGVPLPQLGDQSQWREDKLGETLGWHAIPAGWPASFRTHRAPDHGPGHFWGKLLMTQQTQSECPPPHHSEWGSRPSALTCFQCRGASASQTGTG